MRVWVVDDEKCIADTLTIILRNSGHEVSSFYDAQSALEAVASGCPELLISDISMPGMSGVELAMHVCESYPACKILLVSGQAATHNMLGEFQGKGYNVEVLVKPVHPAELLARIAGMGESEAIEADGGDQSCMGGI